MHDLRSSSLGKPSRVPLWLPYLQGVTENPKGTFTFQYNGGSETVRLDAIQSIMIYGDSDTTFDIKILDKIVRCGIPIIIHRRNIGQPIYITSGARPDPQDTLSRQLILRAQSRKSRHVARMLLQAKMRSCSWLVSPISLPLYANVDDLRNIEAKHAKKYWRAYFEELGYPQYIRRGSNPAAQALDAASKFVSGIVLRWVIYHHLSPYHGFLHEPTSYPALVYDLMEPTRGNFELALLETWKRGAIPQEKWIPTGIATLKEALNTKVYTSLTRQIVTRQELLHGTVLSLKYYLLGKQRKFLIPIEGRPNGGRPPKVNFLLYGRHAGRTDFWDEARRISKTP